MLDHFPFFVKINLVCTGLLLGVVAVFVSIITPTLLTPAYALSMFSGTNQLANLYQSVQVAIFSSPTTFPILGCIISVIYYAYFRILFDIVNTGSSSLSRFFSGFRYTPRYILLLLITLPPILIGLICFVIPGFIIWIRLMFSTCYLADKDMGPIEAIRASWNLTRGFTWPLFGFVFLTFVLNIYLPLLLLYPLSMLAPIFLYRQLIDTETTHTPISTTKT